MLSRQEELSGTSGTNQRRSAQGHEGSEKIQKKKENWMKEKRRRRRREGFRKRGSLQAKNSVAAVPGLSRPLLAGSLGRFVFYTQNDVN